MKKDDLFKIARYSFIFAMAIFVAFVATFLIVFHIFFEIENVGAITIGGAGNENVERISGDLNISGVTKGENNLSIENGSVMLSSGDVILFRNYVKGVGMARLYIPSAFDNTIIYETSALLNANAMEMAFWNLEDNRPTFVLNQGEPEKANTFERSLKVGSDMNYDAGYTDCIDDGFIYVDCETDITGADLAVWDDIESKGSIYTQENMLVPSGKLGIGTTTPTVELDVVGDGMFSGNLTVAGLMSGSISLGSDSVTISSGEITFTTSYMGVLGEGGSNDDLDTINGGVEGSILNIYPTDSSSDIKLKNGTGNLDIGSDCDLKNTGHKAELRKEDSNWVLIMCFN